LLSEPRTISLLAEVVHLPMKPTQDDLRDVYNRVCGSCGYENYIRTATGARVERRDQEGSGGFSHLEFTRDRIRFTEDHVGITVEQFADKVLTVLKDAVPVLRIPVFLVQQVTVRAICTPNSFKSAAEFLARSIFQIRDEDFELLGRPTNVHGFRLVFPATREQPYGFNVRVEAYLRDRRSIYIENVGQFNTPVQTTSLETVGRNVEQTSEFIGNNLVPFLSLYDRRCE